MAENNKNKVLGAFIVGFFLATFLLMLIIKIQFGSLEGTVKNAIPYAQTLYDVTHGPTYAEMTGVVIWANDTAKKVTDIPLLGALVPKEISTASDELLTMMDQTKSASESILPALKDVLFWLQMTVPAMIVSFVMLVVGGYLYTKK